MAFVKLFTLRMEMPSACDGSLVHFSCLWGRRLPPSCTSHPVSLLLHEPVQPIAHEASSASKEHRRRQSVTRGLIQKSVCVHRDSKLRSYSWINAAFWAQALHPSSHPLYRFRSWFPLPQSRRYVSSLAYKSLSSIIQVLCEFRSITGEAVAARPRDWQEK